MNFSYYEMLTVIFLITLYLVKNYQSPIVFAVNIFSMVWLGAITISNDNTYYVYAILLMSITTLIQFFYIDKYLKRNH